ncbi:MAG: DUF2752 domain-containing protein [Ruminococcus sp.]|nr:DUF2752 domain-containing protein [Ruminococcus sp.]
MKNERRKNLKAAILPPVLMPLLYMVFRSYKSYYQRYVLFCEIRTFTGIYCPGCGGTHCITALSKGDILSALHYNAALCLGIVIFLLWWIENVAAFFGKKIKLIPDNRIFPYAVTGIIIAYLVLRNIIPALAPL